MDLGADFSLYLERRKASMPKLAVIDPQYNWEVRLIERKEPNLGLGGIMVPENINYFAYSLNKSLARKNFNDKLSPAFALPVLLALELLFDLSNDSFYYQNIKNPYSFYRQNINPYDTSRKSHFLDN